MTEPSDRSALLARSWDEAAAGYEAYFVPRFAPWVSTAVAAIAAAPLPDGPVLVPCCGTFPELAQLAEQYDGRELVGIDLSAGMLRLARNRAEQLERQVSLVEGDAVVLDRLWTGACAAVLSVFGLQQLPDPAAALQSWAAALRPGGRLAVMFWPETTEVDGPFAMAERAAGVATGDDTWEHELLPALAAKGLTIERHERIAHEVTHPDGATFFDAYTRWGPMRRLADTRGTGFVEAARRAFLAGAPSGRWSHRPEATLIVAQR